MAQTQTTKRRRRGLRAGDRAYRDFGNRRVRVDVIEDLGPIGVGGRQLVRIRWLSADGEVEHDPIVPAEELILSARNGSPSASRQRPSMTRRRVRVGDRAMLRIGDQRIPVEVIEDRGFIGVGGRQIVRIRWITADAADARTHEVPAQQLIRSRSPVRPKS